MLPNRSMPLVTVIPVLAYPDVDEAAAFLTGAFGFRARIRIGSHRIQMHVGTDGALVLRQSDIRVLPETADYVMIRVENVDAHFERAKAFGANVKLPPADYSYGERQYSVVDPGGHSWTFSQSIADADPGEWGGEVVGVR